MPIRAPSPSRDFVNLLSERILSFEDNGGKFKKMDTETPSAFCMEMLFSSLCRDTFRTLRVNGDSYSFRCRDAVSNLHVNGDALQLSD